VERFAQTTYDEFYKATSDMQSKGCKKVILDLRGNGGGLMDQAVKMIEEFLTEDKVVLMTDGVHQGKEEIKSSKKGQFRDMQVVVMIDQGSASASEIVAGALQDWDRSITVGRRSFGKGLVQHEIELPDKSAMRLTVARYYTPTGRCIQKPYGDTINYSDDLHRRLVKGELTNKDSIHFPDSLRFTTLGGGNRTVYGGGGIMPDIFVPIDSVFLSGALGQLSYSGAIRTYCFNYTDKHRAELSKYKDSDDFIKKFVITDAMVAELVKNAEADKVKISSKALKAASPEIKMRVKAQIARNMYDDNAMYKVMTMGDRDFRKALEVAEEYKEFAAVRPNEKR
jgi:carboxyl-terminal processing protease